MKPCWKAAGLTEDGAKLADVALPDMIKALELAGAGVGAVIMDEAWFRVHELPKRSATYRRKYLKDNR